MNQRVWVIDTSAIIHIKKTVRPRDQWRLFKQLETMVEEGTLFFPKQVTAELEEARHVDTPEAWGLEVGPKVTRAYDPDPALVQRVMTVAGDVVDADREDDPGDPYVLAQALQLASAGLDVCVVTDDVVDHVPLRISMATACRRLNLEHQPLSQFLVEIGFE